MVLLTPYQITWAIPSRRTLMSIALVTVLSSCSLVLNFRPPNLLQKVD
jgi:hypothetical protein